MQLFGIATHRWRSSTQSCDTDFAVMPSLHNKMASQVMIRAYMQRRCIQKALEAIHYVARQRRQV